MTSKRKVNNKRTNILELCWHPEVPYAGGSFHCQSKALEQYVGRNHINFHIIDKENTQLNQFTSSNIHIHMYTIPKYIHRVRSLNYPLGRLLEWAYLIPKIYLIASNVIVKEKIDRIYLPIGESGQLTLVAKYLSERHGLPASALLHQFSSTKPLKDTLRDRISIARKAHAFLEQLYVHTTRRGLKRRLTAFQRVASISSALSERVEQTLGVKVITVPYGFDLEPYLSVPEQDKIYDAVYLGRITESKGINDLIELWRRVVTEQPDSKLLIIGDGLSMYTNDIKKTIKSYGLEKNIILAGQKNSVEKIKLLKASKVFIFLSYFESYADVVTEAIVCGLPIIAYDLPAYYTRKKYSEQIYLFQIHDYEAIKKRLTLLLKLPAASFQAKHLESIPTWRNFAEVESELLFETRF
jgi:glycosyltransferase involved in cell wall biosynthesis